MIDRTKIPSFFRDFPEERLKELMEEDKQPNRMGFDDTIDVILRKPKRKRKQKRGVTSINKRKKQQ